jgi:hypothetical protein
MVNTRNESPFFALYGHEKSPILRFMNMARAISWPIVWETGTRQSEPPRSTMHGRDWVPHAGKIIGIDIQPGADVDVVADLEDLSHYVGVLPRPDIVISCSVYEHLHHPWRATREIASWLNPGGLLYIQTHQTFPLHGYPDDCWRFTTETLSMLCADEGLHVIESCYEFPCKIYSAADPGGEQAPAYLNVYVLAVKP